MTVTGVSPQLPSETTLTSLSRLRPVARRSSSGGCSPRRPPPRSGRATASAPPAPRPRSPQAVRLQLLLKHRPGRIDCETIVSALSGLRRGLLRPPRRTAHRRRAAASPASSTDQHRPVPVRQRPAGFSPRRSVQPCQLRQFHLRDQLLPFLPAPRTPRSADRAQLGQAIRRCPARRSTRSRGPPAASPSASFAIVHVRPCTSNARFLRALLHRLRDARRDRAHRGLACCAPALQSIVAPARRCPASPTTASAQARQRLQQRQQHQQTRRSPRRPPASAPPPAMLAAPPPTRRPPVVTRSQNRLQ